MPQGWHRGPGHRENPPVKPFLRYNRFKLPGFLNSQSWVFVSEDLDDFRKGCQPCQNPAIRHWKGTPLTGIQQEAPQAVLKKRQNELPREAELSAKLSAGKQAQKAFTEGLEADLEPHPLALYPHLEEALPAELLLQVLAVLDPERKLKDAWAYCQNAKKTAKEPTKLLKKRSSQVCLRLPKKMPVSHSGQLLGDEKPKEMNLPHKDSAPLQENIHESVSDFCAWVAALGCANIDEEFILKQFDVTYQSGQSLDEGHEVKPIKVAPRLKKNAGLIEPREAALSQKSDHQRRPQKPKNSSKPKGVKMRYGAWYLSTDLWKRQRADEPLVDPKDLCREQEEAFKKELQEQELALADLRGTGAFKDFILRRGYRMPRLLENTYTKKKIKSPRTLTYRRILGR